MKTAKERMQGIADVYYASPGMKALIESELLTMTHRILTQIAAGLQSTPPAPEARETDELRRELEALKESNAQREERVSKLESWRSDCDRIGGDVAKLLKLRGLAGDSTK